jgi:deoxyuridine 5'-triphosphate nucleotidohydrolase
MIPFKIKLLTETAKAPTKENEGDLWDLYADDFCSKNLKDFDKYGINRKVADLKGQSVILNIAKYKLSDIGNELKLYPQGRILVKTGISLELPVELMHPKQENWVFEKDLATICNNDDIVLLESYAVADIRPRSGLALKHGITVLNTPGTIDNSYRKEIGVILYNAGHEPYTITKGDKICQMLIRPLYPSKMEIVENIEDSGRGGFGSTGK